VVLAMLCNFLKLLPDRDMNATAVELVEGNAVELIVGHLAKGGEDPRGASVFLLELFASIPQGQERMGAHGVVEQLMKWLAPVLREVRNVLVSIRVRWEMVTETKGGGLFVCFSSFPWTAPKSLGHVIQ
jgi:hypothetical protein